MSYVVVFVTAKDAREAKKITTGLLNAKLAACVSVVSGVNSAYWWKGKIEKSREVLMIIKTEKSMLKKLVRNVKKVHSYSVPEIIALPIIGGSKYYLDWIHKSVFSSSCK